MWFERNVGIAEPATTALREAPKVAILVSSVLAPGNTNSDSAGVLQQLFGTDAAQYVPTTVGTSSLEYASSDPLAAYNVIYNLGASWPTSASIATSNGATESGSTVTITMSSANDLAVADSVTIAGVSVAGYNGTFTVTKVDSTTQFEYTNAVTGLANSGRGTVADTAMNPVAQSRLNVFFTRKGGYIAANASANDFTFLSAASLVGGTLTQGSQSAYGGIALWANAGGSASPISGGYPSQDTMYLPQNTTYFTSVPTGAVTDGQYLSNFATVGSATGYVAGLWNNRLAAANSAPVLVHGATSTGSRYVGYATNPFSRYDDSRDWPLVVQAALWSDLTDEGTVSYATASTAAPNGAISPSGDVQLAVGSSETYTIKPDPGYVIADVTVDGQSVGNASSYTFENVGAAHAIRATFSDVRGPDVSAGWRAARLGERPGRPDFHGRRQRRLRRGVHPVRVGQRRMDPGHAVTIALRARPRSPTAPWTTPAMSATPTSPQCASTPRTRP